MSTAPAPVWIPHPRTQEFERRERELVALVAQGRTNAQIAAELHISVRTVGSHRTGSGTRPAAAAAST